MGNEDREGREKKILDDARRLAKPPPRKDLTPGFAGVSDAELQEACVTMMAVAIRLLRSKDLANDLYWITWGKILTTRPYDPAKGPVVAWLLLVAKSAHLDRLRENASLHRAAPVHERFHREERPLEVGSAEDQMIEDEEALRRQAEANEDIAALRERAATHPLALQVFNLRQEHEGIKPKEIAERLGVDIKKVYQANEALQDYFKAIAKARREAPEGRDERARDENP